MNDASAMRVHSSLILKQDKTDGYESSSMNEYIDRIVIPEVITSKWIVSALS